MAQQTGMSAANKSLVARERPTSSRKFQELAATDPELKVLYRHSNFRRMPLTIEQLKWIEEQEKLRKLSVEAAESKGDANKGKAMKTTAVSTGGKPKPSKPADKKDSKQLPVIASFIPSFDTTASSQPSDANGPMRQKEILECERVEAAFKKFLGVDEASMEALSQKLRTVLITPQDRPECLSVFNMRGPTEGLRINPAAPDRWRKFASTKKNGKRKKVAK
jgi:hypothetical protein